MKKATVLPLVLVILVSGALACGQEPAATLVPTAMPMPGPTPTPLPMQAAGWEGVTLRTLCLQVEQSFPEMPPELEDVATPHISEATQRILGKLGLQVAEVSCDATLAITVTGQAIREQYRGIGHCYEGAEVNGELVLAALGRTTLTVPISSRHLPPSMISSQQCNKEPFAAPFSLVWPQALLDGLTQLWGPQVPIAAIQDEEWTVSSAALRLLGRIGPVEGVVPAIIQILETDERYMVRADAALALGGMGAEEGVVPALVRALQDEDEDASVHLTATVALGLIGPEAAEAVPALVQIMRGKHEYVNIRTSAAKALGQIGPETPEVIPALIQALEDEWSLVREAAAEALGEIGAKALEAAPALIRTLGDEEESVREVTAEALVAITGQDYGEDTAAWQEWWEEQQ